MATEENTLENVVLNELKLPLELLKVFEELGFDLINIIRISKDELAAALLTTGVRWNIEDIFGRLVRWRQVNGYEIHNFEKLEIEEYWIEEDEDPGSPEECKLDNPIAASEIEVAGDLESISASDSANIVAAQYDSLHVEPVACSSRQVASNPPGNIRSPQPQVQPELSESGSAIVAADCQPIGLQKTPPASEKPLEKPNVSNVCSIECSNHQFTPLILSRLLESTITGKQLLERGIIGPLTPESQRELVSIIADYHNQKGLQASETILSDYARAITALFKSESKDIYFIERGGIKKNPGGKIYNKIVNSKQKNAKRKHKEEEFLKAVKKAPEPTCIVNTAATDAVVWLERNSKPWGTTIEKWIASFPVRKSLLMRRELAEKLFKDFRQYEEECGYQLIDEDFRLLNVGDDQGLKKWEYALPKLIQYVDKPYKDELSKSISEYIKSPHLSQCVQITAILLLLNNFLRPTKVTKTFKPSILSAQEDIILFATTDEQVIKRLDEANSSYAQHGFPPVARLVFRGQNIQYLTGVFEVHYRGITYKLETAARAIEVLVKLNTIFGLEFSRVTRLVWNFVCSYLYEINIQEHYESINKLKRFLASASPC